MKHSSWNVSMSLKYWDDFNKIFIYSVTIFLLFNLLIFFLLKLYLLLLIIICLFFNVWLFFTMQLSEILWFLSFFSFVGVKLKAIVSITFILFFFVFFFLENFNPFYVVRRTFWDWICVLLIDVSFEWIYVLECKGFLASTYISLLDTTFCFRALLVDYEIFFLATVRLTLSYLILIFYWSFW